VNRKEHQLLLYRMMPKRAIAKLQRGEDVVEQYDEVTIFFSDIIGFTSMVEEMTPIEVMRMLNELYTIFDALVEEHDVYKVETIGDTYMVLGGAPNVCPPSEGAAKVALFAVAALDAVRNFRKQDATSVRERERKCVCVCVIGLNMPRYDLFGDTVNLAARMESTSESMRIQARPPQSHIETLLIYKRGLLKPHRTIFTITSALLG
ncbi:nucleotide cyclase, partial [Baffinella frigidus]